MRISTRESDRGYHPLAKNWFEALLDGQARSFISADEEAGTLEHTLSALNLNSGEYKDGIDMGEVVIRVRSDISTGSASMAQRMLDNMRAQQAAASVVVQAIEPVEPVTQSKRLPKTKA